MLYTRTKSRCVYAWISITALLSIQNPCHAHRFRCSGRWRCHCACADETSRSINPRDSAVSQKTWISTKRMWWRQVTRMNIQPAAVPGKWDTKALSCLCEIYVGCQILSFGRCSCDVCRWVSSSTTRPYPEDDGAMTRSPGSSASSEPRILQGSVLFMRLRVRQDALQISVVQVFGLAVKSLALSQPRHCLTVHTWHGQQLFTFTLFSSAMAFRLRVRKGSLCKRRASLRYLTSLILARKQHSRTSCCSFQTRHLISYALCKQTVTSSHRTALRTAVLTHSPLPAFVHKHSGAHPTSYSRGTKVTFPRSEAAIHTPSCSAEVKN
jgi:hypothetical protein